MNRSSGMVIFSSAYALCIVVIVCCLHIKHDVRELRQDELISPAVNQLRPTGSREPVRYVLMNPIKPKFDVQLAQRNQEPNILVATLPSEEIAVKETPHPTSRKLTIAAAEQVVSHSFDSSWMGMEDLVAEAKEAKAEALAKVAMLDLLLAPNNEDFRPQAVAQAKSAANSSPFSLASSTRSRKRPAGNSLAAARPSKVSNEMTVEPHVLIANDDEAFANLKAGIQFLSHIGYDSFVLESLENHIDELSDNGSLDSGNCEATLYRFLVDVEQLQEFSNAEDGRLIESIRQQMIHQINRWIDQLNGVEPSQPELEEDAEIGFQKWNTALRTLIWHDLF